MLTLIEREEVKELEKELKMLKRRIIRIEIILATLSGIILAQIVSFVLEKFL